MDNLLKQQRNMTKDIWQNASNRVVVCFCVDTSLSMADRIEAVNNGILRFIDGVRSDPYAANAIDMSIVSFNTHGVKTVMPFSNVKTISFTPLKADGKSPIGEAVLYAISKIDERLGQYDEAGVVYYRPWLIIMSDGKPSDDVSDAAAKVRERIAKEELKVKCINMSEDTEDNALDQFTLSGKTETISSLKMNDFFTMLSRGASGLSRMQVSDDQEQEFF